LDIFLQLSPKRLIIQRSDLNLTITVSEVIVSYANRAKIQLLWHSREEHLSFGDVGIWQRGDALRVTIENAASMEIRHILSPLSPEPFLEMTFHHLSENLIERVLEEEEEGQGLDLGVLWSSGLLRALSYTAFTRKDNSLKDLCPSNVTNRYCKCKFLSDDVKAENDDEDQSVPHFVPAFPDDGYKVSVRTQNTLNLRTFLQKLPLDVRLQACCDRLVKSLKQPSSAKGYSSGDQAISRFKRRL